MGKIAAGKHVLQTDPRAFLEAYSRRPKLSLEQLCGHVKPVKTIQRIEVMLWKGIPKYRIAKKLGISYRVVDHVSRGTHALQVERANGTLEWPTKIGTGHSREEVDAVIAAYQSGEYSKRALSSHFGMTPRTILRITRGLHIEQLSDENRKLRTWASQPRALRTIRNYMPSPRKIARQCAEIRKMWTPAEREERWYGPAPWTPQEHAQVVA